MTTWKMAGLSDVGCVREHNEDAIEWNAEQGWAVLADGMGGHQAGEVASAIAVDVIGQALKAQQGNVSVELLQRAVMQANDNILQHAAQSPELLVMGTTVVALSLQEERLYCAHVGDSRLYRLRDGELNQLTHDHSLVQELVDEGMMDEDQARHSQQKNVITRALGLEAELEVDLLSEAVENGDSYLLCSDGLSDRLADYAIKTLLQGESLPEIARGLVDAACEQGGEDNISVILIQVWE